jgi:hypothetical protein
VCACACARGTKWNLGIIKKFERKHNSFGVLCHFPLGTSENLIYLGFGFLPFNYKIVLEYNSSLIYISLIWHIVEKFSLFVGHTNVHM